MTLFYLFLQNLTPPPPPLVFDPGGWGGGGVKTFTLRGNQLKPLINQLLYRAWHRPSHYSVHTSIWIIGLESAKYACTTYLIMWFNPILTPLPFPEISATSTFSWPLREAAKKKFFSLTTPLPLTLMAVGTLENKVPKKVISSLMAWPFTPPHWGSQTT